WVPGGRITVTLLALLAFLLLLSTFVLQPFQIPSGSMERGLRIGDRVLVNKLVVAVAAIVLLVGGALWANRGDEPAADPKRAASASPLSEATDETTENAAEEESEEPSEETTPTEAASETASETPSESPSASETAGATAEGIDAFIRNYLATAPDNPDSAFSSMLTPAFQASSGGIEGYRNWWGSVASTSVVSVSPSVDPLQVTYTYTYTMKDGRNDGGTVTLGLVYDDGRYLIDTEG
ncbi:S26 family signal peptidase, partial [Nocardioides sp. NPDC057772]|uniref:S26 family signal peptidase n=1 Tax=Nocardioides sp. NPDC057772 TaxID=3346245 RepID=UPI003673440A